MNESLLRETVPAVIGVLVRRGADFAAAEDAVQEALIRALETWPDDPPRDAKVWLVAAAWRKFLDAARQLSRVPQSHPQGEWARYARELSYHNALWSAAAAGQLEKTKAELEKASREDSVLAEKIRAMLVDAPAQCEKP